ncbi:hypothetical protein KNJ79_03065 [Sphingopyxis indica]|uniref:putative 2OG-Fe(II) oxygenase n=1 Tax=Sphingopyxis indica TaxID=436663 RepID=UPI00293941BC|nr:putative 2OG-Fe(II) oxygenase [Sphingopyxis indica]WOF43950.1 hypothetical protein KNJ79_03065 [Sphingopyxis indica]
MNRQDADDIAHSLPLDDPEAAFRSGIVRVRAGHFDALAGAVREVTRRHPAHGRLWQLRGLVARALGLGGEARDAFARAASLLPADPLIAHSHARAALEAGDPAVALFDRAAKLAPADGSLLQGRAAAQIAEGAPERAIADLEAILRRNPMWLDGQRTLARIYGQLGCPPAAGVTAALDRLPAQPELHREHIHILLEAQDLAGAAAACAAAKARIGRPDWLTDLMAHIESEQGQIAAADALFDTLPEPRDADAVSGRARHLVRANRPDAAIALIEPWIGRDEQRLLWPYLSLAWRMTDDPRWQWLEGHEALVRTFDLGDSLGDLDALAHHLRRLHTALAPPLDQSVRGGTQTDGNLLVRAEPEIEALRSTLLTAVDAYIAGLPLPEEGHPTLLPRRDPVRIAGAWSVRLEGEGFHTDHVHSQGWISSALYIALPETSPEGAARHEGWLSLGEARDLVPGLAPLRLIEPRPGRLVLFPSTMWHGTRPFPAGERLTVAFDIARPPQG